MTTLEPANTITPLDPIKLNSRANLLFTELHEVVQCYNKLIISKKTELAKINKKIPILKSDFGVQCDILNEKNIENYSNKNLDQLTQTVRAKIASFEIPQVTNNNHVKKRGFSSQQHNIFTYKFDDDSENEIVSSDVVLSTEPGGTQIQPARTAIDFNNPHHPNFSNQTSHVQNQISHSNGTNTVKSSLEPLCNINSQVNSPSLQNSNNNHNSNSTKAKNNKIESSAINLIDSSSHNTINQHSNFSHSSLTISHSSPKSRDRNRNVFLPEHLNDHNHRDENNHSNLCQEKRSEVQGFYYYLVWFY